MKKTKRALFHSLIALLLCVSMFVGTTFAWFTDEVTSMNNIIQSGRLDIELEYRDADGEWQPVDQDTNVFDPNALWEPGHTEVVYLRVKNLGNLALKYELGVNVASQTLGTNVYGDPFKLSDYIEMGAVKDMASTYATREDARNAVTASGTLSSGYVTYGSMEAGAAEQYIALVVYMPEEVDNVANYKTGTTPPTINLGITLLATQMTAENDSFGNNYDEGAKHPLGNINFTSTQSIADKMEDGQLTEAVTVGSANGDIYAEVPSGVKLADGADSLSLTVQTLETSQADVSATNRSEVVYSVDVHIDGVAEGNTVPMIITINELFPTGLNNNNVKLYHVENGQTVEMTLVDNPVNHNEFSYDPLTGNAVIAIASFSEITSYADTDADWDGTTVDYTWYNADATELTIANAQQFVAFRNIVDGVEIDGVYVIDDFKGQKITLNADINLNGHNFDPIGWGYANAAWNAGGAEGKVFKGHFDGGNHTISGLYQSGWELESTTETDYTYTNCGGGLFAAACDATFENLTIDGADITFECVEIGVLVGLAQGNCTFNNINITGCKIANYQRPAGGVVGEVSPKIENGTAVASTHTFNNVYVDSNTVVGTLWGDFDAPVGGVIGAYWDDAGKTSVVMNGVTVACRLDVYNDVTSTYQWYAYRRAGMLIGNTDHSEKNANGTNIASTKIDGIEFLTCSNVIVFYGDWANYHYCEFHDSNPNWPWVRVEPGENCSGYNNPRWGRATDPVTGEAVVDSMHNHGTAEGHLVTIPFHQLYGGGQGVYGAETHEGVTEGIYTVTYMDRGEVLHVDYVTDNTVAYDDIWPIENASVNGETPTKWVDANSNDFTGVGVGNTANVIVYPKWPNEYTIRCLDTYGNVAYYNFVTDDNTTGEEYEAIATDINNTLAAIQNEVDAGGKVIRVVWKDASGELLTTTDANGDIVPTDITSDYIANASDDIILTATPQLLSGSISLTPVYDETTGELVAYHVTDVVADDTNISIDIPDYVGTVPVTKITEGAFDSFDNLHAVKIPNTVTTLDKSMFPGSTTSRQTVTIYYEGTKEQWLNELNKVDASSSTYFITTDQSWDNSLGTGSRVFFLDSTGKVNVNEGYLEVTSIDRGSPNDVVWTSYDNITQAIKDACTANCDCEEVCKGEKQRPDAIYWEGVTIN